MPVISPSELHGLCYRACIAQGYPFGIAEEAALSVEILAALGLPSVHPLVEVLLRCDATLAKKPIVQQGRVWLQKPYVNPFYGCCLLMDRYEDGRWELELRSVHQPILLAASMLRLCMAHRCTLAMEWNHHRIDSDAQGLCVSLATNLKYLSTADGTASVRLFSHDRSFVPTHRLDYASFDVDAADYETLVTIQTGYYVPASADSRMGAGSQQSDND